MSRPNRCRVCKQPLTDSYYPLERVCYTCAKAAPVDFIYDCGTFHIEAKTSLMTRKEVQRMMRKLPVQ